MAISIAIFLMLSMTASTMLIPSANAQGHAETVPTIAYLACSPNPIGVNQSLLVNIWVTPPVDWAGVPRTGYTVKITHPDGTVQTIGPLTTVQADGSAWFNFVPDAVGNWTLQFFYAGDYFPVGTPYKSPKPPYPYAFQTTYAVNYTGSESPITHLNVTEAQVPGYQPTPLPTAYWQTPISVENREWSQLLGDWCQVGYDSTGDFYQPYGQAPNSAHILWARTSGLGGMVGGAYNDSIYSGVPVSDATYQGGVLVLGYQYTSVIYTITIAIAGLGYYSAPDGVHCIDLRTGQQLWVNQNITLSVATSEEYVTIGFGSPTDSYNAYLMNIGSRLQKWSAYTGTLICDVPGMSGTFVAPYVYSVQTIGSGATAQNYLIKWNASGISANFTSRIVYNVTYPLNGITGIWNNVGFYFGVGAATTILETPIVPSGSFDTDTGQILWTNNFTIAERSFSSLSGVITQEGTYVYALLNGDPNNNGLRPLAGIDLLTGAVLFNDTVTTYPWGSFWSYSKAAAYGMVYYPTYTGYVWAINATTGAIEWKGGYNPVGYETPYGWETFFSQIMVANGKVYASNNEHSEAPPYYQGDQLWCLNATTGATIWNIAFWSPNYDMQPIIADGLLIATNYYDGRQYCFGMGPSATTVTAPNLGVTTSTPVTITGTVLDKSPGNQQQLSAEFPNGLPAYLMQA